MVTVVRMITIATKALMEELLIELSTPEADAAVPDLFVAEGVEVSVCAGKIDAVPVLDAVQPKATVEEDVGCCTADFDCDKVTEGEGEGDANWDALLVMELVGVTVPVSDALCVNELVCVCVVDDVGVRLCDGEAVRLGVAAGDVDMDCD